MPSPDDLKTLSDDDLDMLAEAVARELQRRKNKRARSAIKKAKELLAFAGYDVQLIPLEDASSIGVREKGAAKPKMSVPPGSYRNPDKPSETYTAPSRGRLPKWLREALESGMDLSAYRTDREKADETEDA